MPSATLPELPVIPKWNRPGKTNEELDWADIKIIDLSSFDELGGKQKLAEELRDAVRRILLDNELVSNKHRCVPQASSASSAQDLPKKR